jgi:hypothetical protein
MQLPPPSVLASWPQPNYENPSVTRGPAVLILTLVFAPITFIIVLLRTYTRVCISRSFGADDTCILLALIPTLICGILTLLAVHSHGWDRHSWDVPAEQLTTGLKYGMAVEVTFAIAGGLTKMSLLFFLRRIMTTATGVVRRIGQIVMVIVGAEMVVFTIVVINTCK